MKVSDQNRNMISTGEIGLFLDDEAIGGCSSTCQNEEEQKDYSATDTDECKTLLTMTYELASHVDYLPEHFYDQLVDNLLDSVIVPRFDLLRKRDSFFIDVAFYQCSLDTVDLVALGIQSVVEDTVRAYRMIPNDAVIFVQGKVSRH